MYTHIYHIMCQVLCIIFMPLHTLSKRANHKDYQNIFQSTLLIEAAFSSSWINRNSEYKKMLLIFMERSQKPLKIYAGKLLELNLVTFSTVKLSFLSCILLKRI